MIHKLQTKQLTRHNTYACPASNVWAFTFQRYLVWLLSAKYEDFWAYFCPIIIVLSGLNLYDVTLGMLYLFDKVLCELNVTALAVGGQNVRHNTNFVSSQTAPHTYFTRKL